MAPPTLSLIIPTYRATDLVVNAVAALGDAPAGCESIIVDDGSGDGTVERLRAALPAVRIVALDANRGFGGAVNAGFQAATGDYLATLNNDALTTWDDLLALVSFLEANAAAGAGPSR